MSAKGLEGKLNRRLREIHRGYAVKNLKRLPSGAEGARETRREITGSEFGSWRRAHAAWRPRRLLEVLRDAGLLWIWSVTRPPRAVAHLTSVLSSRFLTRPDSIFAT